MHTKINVLLFIQFQIGDPKSDNFLQLKNQLKFASARYSMFNTYPTIGLSIATDSPIESNLIYEAYKDSLIQNPVYSMHYRQCNTENCENAGMLVVGGEDQENCEPVPAMFETRCNNGTLLTFYINTVFRHPQYNSIRNPWLPGNQCGQNNLRHNGRKR